ncbi:uncharacterized protein Nmag_4196 (plasmid) [Natrialba magadii ATCC 43099]|uniref:Uncharacterized protein n=1 Tax=Natrialba magadii (strain ATCC 43099 / DSM 3394 / CCM 3739 / CIP 104546 / IAM 13178 / JCM 8861 / NBRC 102185 / NCIMB 2190 / MS3) TaxID=547559 RepID=D3T295_NATMM|nr:uncharacterized protein Nmag_4196 [Natrialba magadii ATCC 43099]ELY26516.1 hypothetical protein C500_15175 [Natrialba magadii ATCC 43099]
MGGSPDGPLNTTSNDQSSQSDDDPRAVATILSSFRSEPTVWIPFLVAGCLLWLVDVLRERDSLPVQPSGSASTLEITYSLYPVA